MELDDLPVVYSMYKDGLVNKPSFIPPWAMNLNYLICFFTFQYFLKISIILMFQNIMILCSRELNNYLSAII